MLGAFEFPLAQPLLMPVKLVIGLIFFFMNEIVGGEDAAEVVSEKLRGIEVMIAFARFELDL